MWASPPTFLISEFIDTLSRPPWETAAANHAPMPVMLEPVWEVVIDVETMLVDGVTGAMSAVR